MSGSTSPVGTIPITTISSTGVLVPTYESIYAAFVSAAQAIFGANIYVAEDSQDGQYIGTVAQAVLDCCNAVAAAYNGFSPNTAQGTGLSSVVKINGIMRELPTNSTVNLLITGTPGKTINNGIAADDIGNQWALPTSVNIPSGGTVTVTATAVALGPVTDAAGSITSILTPTAGWISVTNPSDASPGTSLEDDAQLRVRQTSSTALPSQSILAGLQGALLAVAGVVRLSIVENDTDTVNSDGVPANAVAVVIEGGDTQDIVNAIATRKTLGSPTYGTTNGVYTDQYGNITTINYSVPSATAIGVNITLKALNGYNEAIGVAIQNNVAAFANANPIGMLLSWMNMLVAAAVGPGVVTGTFNIESFTQGIIGDSFSQSDIDISWNSAATCSASNVVLTVT